MKLKVNGKNEEAKDGITLLALLSDRKTDPAKTVATVNGNIVAAKDFVSVVLKDGDSVELFSFVAGG